MFLRKNKKVPWIGLLTGALLLALGITALEAGEHDADERGRMGVAETVVGWEDGSEGGIQDTEEAQPWEDGSEEGAFDTEVAQSWEDGSEEGVFDTEAAQSWEDESEEEFWDTEADSFWEGESELEPRDTEETLGEPGGNTASGGWLNSQVLHVIGCILTVEGVILALLMIFLRKWGSTFPGPETELLFLVIGTGMAAEHLRIPVMAGRIVELWAAFFLLLMSVGGLWQWLRAGIPYTRSTAHRLGVRVMGNPPGHGRYLVFQFVWTLVMSAGCIAAFIWAWGNTFSLTFLLWMAGAGFLISAVLSGYCFVKSAGNMDHLSEQIRRLHSGEEFMDDGRDFADEERLLRDLSRQREEAVRTAVASERFRVDLISNVSHDLRTPLTAILGCGELLKGEKLSEDGARQLAELNRKAGYMYELVESLFELTKVSSGVAESKKEKIDLIRLLEQTIGLFDDDLRKHKLEVRRHYESDSIMLVTDGTRLHQVFANLIGNAIKYTLPGTRIHLDVKKENQEYTIRMVNISSYEMDFDENEILERFARGDKARSTKGSGLGLAIAKTYTESVGGSFRVFIDGEQFNAVVTLLDTERFL